MSAVFSNINAVGNPSSAHALRLFVTHAISLGTMDRCGTHHSSMLTGLLKSLRVELNFR